MRKLWTGSGSRRVLSQFSLLLSLLSLDLACVSHSARLKPVEEGVQPMKGLRGQPQPEAWFSGSPQAAFDLASKNGKLVFLYWGAVWCPPCNELKANVFSKPRFAELMQAFVPVYLDGDTEEAQTWGEQLKISGYPTILVLNAQKQELFRLNSSVSIQEFDEALSSLLGQSRNLSLVLDKLAGTSTATSLDTADWKILAFADWEQLAKRSAEERLRLLEKATRLCPENLAQEKALLAASLLRLAVDSETKEVAGSPLQKELRALAPAYLERVFQGRANPLRSFVNNQASATLTWLFPEGPRGPAYEDLKKKWFAAAARNQAEETASIDTRLWAVYPQLEFFRFEQPEGAVPPALKKEVQTAVEQANRQATHPFDRHAVISGAAYLLRKVGDFDGAQELLKAEAARSDTPWYYYSSLAALEQERQRPKEAQNWGALARQSAEGRASKIQWITSDIALNAKPAQAQEKAYLLSLAQEYYALATELSDGFVGRNRTRAKKVAETLGKFHEDPEFARVFQKFEPRCGQLRGENAKFCQEHFEALRATKG